MEDIDYFMLSLSGKDDDWRVMRVEVYDNATQLPLAVYDKETVVEKGGKIRIDIFEHLSNYADSEYSEFISMEQHNVVNLSVTIKTSSRKNSGTDNDVWFSIVPNPNVDYLSTKYLLNKKGHNDFERGDYETYPVELQRSIDFTDISHFLIQKDGRDLWRIESVEVRNDSDGVVLGCMRGNTEVRKEGIKIPATREYTSVFDEEQMIRELTVAVKTKDELYAGTDNNVTFQVQIEEEDENGTVTARDQRFLLDKPLHDDLERGTLETYHIRLDRGYSRSQIKRFVIRKSGSDDWNMEYITISDRDSGLVLAKNKEGHKFTKGGIGFEIESGKWIDI